MQEDVKPIACSSKHLGYQCLLHLRRVHVELVNPVLSSGVPMPLHAVGHGVGRSNREKRKAWASLPCGGQCAALKVVLGLVPGRGNLPLETAWSTLNPD